jgi:hypothetical protein
MLVVDDLLDSHALRMLAHGASDARVLASSSAMLRHEGKAGGLGGEEEVGLPTLRDVEITSVRLR